MKEIVCSAAYNTIPFINYFSRPLSSSSTLFSALLSFSSSSPRHPSRSVLFYGHPLNRTNYRYTLQCRKDVRERSGRSNDIHDDLISSSWEYHLITLCLIPSQWNETSDWVSSGFTSIFNTRRGGCDKRSPCRALISVPIPLHPAQLDESTLEHITQFGVGRCQVASPHCLLIVLCCISTEIWRKK